MQLAALSLLKKLRFSVRVSCLLEKFVMVFDGELPRKFAFGRGGLFPLVFLFICIFIGLQCSVKLL